MPVRFCVDRALDGERLARAVARKLGVPSVREAKLLVDLGRVFLDDRRETIASTAVREGMWVEVHRDRARPAGLDPGAVVWRGESLLAISKPAGVPVAGTRGRTEGSVLPMLEALLRGEEGGAGPGRLELVHRLDRDTSGLLLVARDPRARRDLEEQFLRRLVKKRYLALVHGAPGRARFRQSSPVEARRPAGEGPRPGRPSRGGGRTLPARDEAEAVTEFEVLERLSGYALVEARPITGRTHQIRIHLVQRGLPVLGDPVYGPLRCADPLARAVPRQMLHAADLLFRDPDTGREVALHAPLPEDMESVLRRLRRSAGGAGLTRQGVPGGA